MILYGSMRDIAGDESDGTVLILSRVTRESTVTPGEMITREIHREPVEDGLFRIEGLDPGPVTIEVTAGNEYSRWDLNLPEGDGEYNIVDLVELQIEWEPEVVGRAQAAQRAAEAAAVRAKEGADRVGSAEAVIAAKNAAVAAAGAADTSAENADRSAGDADRSAGEAAGSASTAGQKATAADASAKEAADSAKAAFADATATAADRVQTGQDRTATGEDLAATKYARDGAVSASGFAAEWQSQARTQAGLAKTEAERAKSEADRAETAANHADGAAVQAVTERVDTLLAGAPEAYDTLLEIATKLAGQDDVAAAMTAQIGQKAESSVVTALSAKVDGILVALDGKADKGHTHTMAQVTGLDAALGAKLDASKLQVVTAMPATPVAGTIYFVTGV